MIVGLFILNTLKKGGKIIRQIRLSSAGFAVNVDDFFSDIGDFEIQDFADAHAGAQRGFGNQTDHRGDEKESVKKPDSFSRGKESFAGLVRVAEPHLACGGAHGGKNPPFHTLVYEGSE